MENILFFKRIIDKWLRGEKAKSGQITENEMRYVLEKVYGKEA